MKHISIRAKLTLWFATVFVLAQVVVGALYYRILTTRVDRLVNTRLENLCTGLWGYVHFDDEGPKLIYDHTDPRVSHFVQEATRFFQLYDAESGRLVLQSSNPEVIYLLLSPEAVRGKTDQPSFEEITSGTATLRFHSAVFRAGTHAYLLRVGMSAMLLKRMRREMVATFLLLLVPGALLALGAGWYAAKNTLKPIETLRRSAYEIGISKLDRRLPVRGTQDELDKLAATFNEVFERLETSVGNMKQFATSMSHELRTPLGVLQGEAEVALAHTRTAEEYQQVLANQLEEFQHLRWLIERLLELAKAEAGDIQLQPRQMDLAVLLRSLIEEMEPVASEKHISLGLNCTQVPQLTADPQWLERAFLNLLDNAIKFTPEGGKVRVQLSSSDSHARVEVSDTGIGIPQQAMPYIFDRFYQADDSSTPRKGVGLGLTIARWVIDAHKGTVEVRSELGAGSRFTVLLPLANSAAIAAHA